MQLAQQKPQVEIALFKSICFIDEKTKQKTIDPVLTHVVSATFNCPGFENHYM